MMSFIKSNEKYLTNNLTFSKNIMHAALWKIEYISHIEDQSESIARIRSSQGYIGSTTPSGEHTRDYGLCLYDGPCDETILRISFNTDMVVVKTNYGVLTYSANDSLCTTTLELARKFPPPITMSACRCTQELITYGITCLKKSRSTRCDTNGSRKPTFTYFQLVRVG